MHFRISSSHRAPEAGSATGTDPQCLSNGRGGAKRSAPMGGAAYGMPRNSCQGARREHRPRIMQGVMRSVPVTSATAAVCGVHCKLRRGVCGDGGIGNGGAWRDSARGNARTLHAGTTGIEAGRARRTAPPPSRARPSTVPSEVLARGRAASTASDGGCCSAAGADSARGRGSQGTPWAGVRKEGCDDCDGAAATATPRTTIAATLLYRWIIAATPRRRNSRVL